MSSDQIVKALRKVVTERCHDTSCKNCVADHFRAMDPVWGACDDGTMLAAADLIESQQAQSVAKDAEVARLTAERAAMIKALQQADVDCDTCKHNGIGDCEEADFDCKNCAQDCPCKWCDGANKWEWHGAEEGMT